MAAAEGTLVAGEENLRTELERNKLRDFLRSMSNAAASNVSGPMDYEVTGTIGPRTPTLRERTAGLLQDTLENVTNRYRARQISETVLGGPSSNLPAQMGLLDPTLVGALFGRQENPEVGPGMPGGLSHAATVWQGSPHKFAPTKNNPLGEFDASKIGTGEGVQAYGHGHYLAENPGTAKYYADAISQKVDYPADAIAKLPESLSANDVKELGTLGQQMRKVGNLPTQDMARWRELYNKADTYNRAVDQYRPKPNLYKVDLPDSAIAKMLDWDKPLSQQPEAVRRSLDVLDADSKKLLAGQDPKGAKLYELLASTDAFAGKGPLGAAASNHLREQGIPGIKYLDQGSRGAGEGTRNYVVFPGNEDLLKILERIRDFQGGSK